MEEDEADAFTEIFGAWAVSQLKNLEASQLGSVSQEAIQEPEIRVSEQKELPLSHYQLNAVKEGIWVTVLVVFIALLIFAFFVYFPYALVIQ